MSGSLARGAIPYDWRLTYAPGTVVAGYNPFGTYEEPLGSLQLPWSLATYREVRGSALGPLEIRVRFPRGRVEYKTVRAPPFDSISIQSVSKAELCPPSIRSYAWRDFWRTTTSISFFATADFDTQRIQIRLEEGGVAWIDPTVRINADLPFPWSAPADTPETQVQLVANPSALRLDQLTSTNRPWIELLVQATEEDRPWAGLPVDVEGPGVGQLVLQELRQTGTYGHYAFYRQPPPPTGLKGERSPMRSTSPFASLPADPRRLTFS